MRRIKIMQGRLLDPANNLDQIGNLYIADDRIVGVHTEPDGFQADLVIDAGEQIVCPGFVDLSVRLREPGFSHKATISSEIRAAAKAGITSLCVPPDTRPVIDTPAVAELIKDKAEFAGYRQVYPIAALTQGLAGNELSSMFALQQAGCIAVSNAQQPVGNLLILHRAMEYAASHDLLLIYRPEELRLRNGGCANEGVFATRYGLPGIPETAETVALAQCLELVEQNGCRVHFSQLSCARSIALLRQAKAKGLSVSADVAMHQLHLTEDDMIPFDSNYHVNPPLRTEYDKLSLRAAVAEGIIDAVCSDHQPHDIDAKLGAFPETEPGIAAMETLLPLMLKLVGEEVLSLRQGIDALSGKPAGILSVRSGSLALGETADVCIFNPGTEWVIDENNWQSRGSNTPYWGKKMQGIVTHTLQSGKLIYSVDAVTADKK